MAKEQGTGGGGAKKTVAKTSVQAQVAAAKTAAPTKPQPTPYYAPVQTSLQAINVIPNVAPVVVPPVTSLQAINQMPAYSSSTLASALGIAGGGAANVGSTTAQNLTVGMGSASVISGLPPVPGNQGVLGAPTVSTVSTPPPGSASATPVAGTQPGAFTGSEPKAAQYYQPPSTAGTLPGAFTGSEPKAAQFYEPPAAGGTAGGTAQQLTLADLGLQGQVNLNTLEGGRGWYLPWYSNGVQGSLDWSTGTFYPAYPLSGGGNAGGGVQQEDGGGGGGGAGTGGGGGYTAPRAGGVVNGLVQWRIGT